ncbi:50S ribosomal protein L22 [archaeon]|nr:50S ribosomal protein L22 [archaeon]
MEAKVNVNDMGISPKTSVEVCRFVRNKEVNKAKKMLERVIEKKMAVPYKRFIQEIPHRRGNMATGRYPIKVCGEILKLIKSAEANAQNLGMGKDLFLYHISASKGSQQWHFGRKRRRVMKRTNIKIILKEIEKKKIEEKKTTKK